MPIPTIITIYSDKSFQFTTKTPPASYLIKKAVGIQKGSSAPGSDSAGSITQKQLGEIAEMKMADLNAHDLDQAKKIIAGSARAMGLKVEA